MRAYYGSRFSPNQTATPEGFLICHNVPISRIGWYEYLGEEIGVDDQTGKVVKVYRSPEVVFSDAAMASFEGKILTDEHPSELVTPDNATRYTRGAVQHVRQGTGKESDLLIADLVVYDKALIDEIQEGKREVSCGYDCVYEPMGDGTYQQKQICGNHVAVVKSGRAGDRVAIKDSKSEIPKGEKKMLKIPRSKSGVTAFLAALGLKQFAADAEPEELQAAIDAMAEGNIEGDKPPAQDADPAIQALQAQLAKLTELVTQLANGAQQPASPEDAIDAEIAKLEGQPPAADDLGDEEESRTIPAASLDEEGPVSSPEDRPKNSLTGDNSVKIAALRAIKPIIAAIPDPVARKQAADAAIASIQGTPAKRTYAAIKPQNPAKDSKATPNDHSQLGREIARKHNPHYKERA
jgi:hypothetical protein